MSNKNKLIISWLLVIVWAITIFVLSAQGHDTSDSQSKGVLTEIVEKTVETTNNVGITDKHPTENSLQVFVEKYNYLFRKIVHGFEYFILTMLLLFALKYSGLNNYKLYAFALLINYLYACSDEYHQTFVPGRTGLFIDTIVDAIGGVFACLVYYLISKFISRIKLRHFNSKEM